MDKIHFLNVKNGDCTLIQHSSGRNTVIDICNGNAVSEVEKSASGPVELCESNSRGNFNQKNHPTNPITYFSKIGIKNIFRFVLTHPDMDHMDGIENLFKDFEISNFWDTDNRKVMDSSSKWNGYKESDWIYYQNLRKGAFGQTVLRVKAGATGKYYNQDDINGKGDGIYILSPNERLIKYANDRQEYNEISYVLLLVMNNGKKVIFAGDSGELVWNEILKEYKDWVKDIDVLIAPHHGRKSGGNYNYLDVLNPKLTLLGNGESEHMDYTSFNRRNLYHITNNQAGNVLLCESGKNMDVFVSNEKFAVTFSSRNVVLDLPDYYHIGTI